MLSFWIISAGVFLGAPMPYPRACLVTWHEFTQCRDIRQRLQTRRRRGGARCQMRAVDRRVGVNFRVELLDNLCRQRAAGGSRSWPHDTQPWVRSCVERMVEKVHLIHSAAGQTSSFTLFSRDLASGEIGNFVPTRWLDARAAEGLAGGSAPPQSAVGCRNCGTHGGLRGIRPKLRTDRPLLRV